MTKRTEKLVIAILSATLVSAIVSIAIGAQGAVAPAVSTGTAADTTHHGTDSAAAQPKKVGMFGKMKGLAHNKIAQNIARTAACTMVPGGQYMMSAIDAKQAKSAGAVAGKAATGAASAALGGGAGCIPGMGSMAGMGGVGGASRAPQMPAAAPIQQSANGDVEIKTDAPGQQMDVPRDIASELAKGKLVIKKVDWVQHGNLPSAPTIQMLSDVMSSVGTAIKANGLKYRVDIYVGKDYPDVEAKQLAPSRITTVIGLINQGAAVGDAVVAGKAGRDKEPRIEIVKVK